MRDLSLLPKCLQGESPQRLVVVVVVVVVVLKKEVCTYAISSSLHTPKEDHF